MWNQSVTRLKMAKRQRWLKDKDSIIAAAADKHRKLYAKQRKSTKYLELYKLLFDQLKAAHDKGREVYLN